MRRKWLNVAIIAAVFGIICAAVSLQNYLNIYKSGIIAGDSFCAVSDYVNCDLVEASSWASIGGIPIAGLGLIYYIMVFVFAVYARTSRGFKKPSVAYAWWTTCLSVLYAIFLGYISMFVLKTLCLTCLGMYIVNIILFVSLYMAMNIPLKDGPTFLWGYWLTVLTGKKRGIDFMPKFFTHLLATVIVFAVGMVFVASASSNIQRLGDAEISEYVDSFYRQSSYDLKFDKEATPMWGTKDAPVTIVEFSDYRCPFCKIAAFMVKPFLAEYKKDIAYYFINYPLDSECNHYMQHQMHPGACLGAKGGICADEKGKYWKYHDDLFRTENRINMTLLKEIAKKLDLNEDEFVNCVNSRETEIKLRNDIETARSVYITGTPSIFVNNRLLKFWKSPEILRAIVKREIAEAK